MALRSRDNPPRSCIIEFMAIAAATWDADEAVRDVLNPGEVVLWMGRPTATRGLDRQDVWFIIVGTWCAVTYWGVAFFGLVSLSQLALRVLPPAIALAFVVIARPAVRRSQRQKTAFAVTGTRVLVVNGPPFPRLETAALPLPYEFWRRSDRRGTVVFDASPRMSRRRSFFPEARNVLQVVLFLVGFVARPFPGRRGDHVHLVFYEVDDVNVVVQTLEHLGLAASRPALLATSVQPGSWTEVVERRFTPARRVLCGVLGAVLLASMIPVLAIRLRDYLQDSPTLPGPGTLHLTLPAATYVVFEHTAKAGPYDCSPVSLCVTIDPSDVSVTSQSGAPVAVYVDPSVDGITDRKDHYAGAVEFDIPRHGPYSISVRSSAAAGFVIAKQPSEEAAALGGWIAGGIVGLLLIVAVLAGSLLARGRRQRHRPSSQPF
jgi:hypothetical protein